MMDRKAFYAALRADQRVFGSSISQGQVDGIERLLDVWGEYYAADGSLHELAYNLATSYHETAYTMQPIKERGGRSYFNKYEPGTRLGRVLGNTQRGDGYRFKGEGDVQNTGRRNARKSSDELNKAFGLDIDFVKNPELRGDPIYSAHCLFMGNRQGWWTGKDIDDFIDGIDENDKEDLREYANARRIVNGTDKAVKIGEHALAFEDALKAADYDATMFLGKGHVSVDVVDGGVEPTAPPQSTETPSSGVSTSAAAAVATIIAVLAGALGESVFSFMDTIKGILQ